MRLLRDAVAGGGGEMRPDEYYHKLSYSIKDAEIRLVAAVMSDYVGEENAVKLDALCRRLGMDERKVRIILAKLVTDYLIPVCAHSGKAGRWMARNYDEARPTQAEHYSRSAEDKRRGDAFNNCHYPPVDVPVEAVQPSMFEVEQVNNLSYWER